MLYRLGRYSWECYWLYSDRIYCRCFPYLLSVRHFNCIPIRERVIVMKNLIFCAVAILFMIGCASSGNQAALDAHADAPATAKQLTGSEIKTTVIGRKHSSVTSTGYPFSQVLSADGTAQIKISSESMQSGSWVVTEDVICITYQKYGKECSRVLSEGSAIWFVDNVTNKTHNKFIAN